MSLRLLRLKAGVTQDLSAFQSLPVLLPRPKLFCGASKSSLSPKPKSEKCQKSVMRNFLTSSRSLTRMTPVRPSNRTPNLDGIQLP